MATGRMQYLSEALNCITEFSFVLTNDPREEESAGNPWYDRPPRTLYLLHGYTGIDTDWLWGGGNAQLLARRYHLNLFLPTGGTSFYLDREGAGNGYGRFVGREFVEYTRATFGLSRRREDTLIGGYSMGGFGALHAAFTYPETFGGAIALSSANPTEGEDPEGTGAPGSRLDPVLYRTLFGDPETAAASLANPRVRARRALEAGAALPPLYLACGTEDPLIHVNRRYRDFFQPRLEQFAYAEAPGLHDWAFWNAHLQQGLEWLLERL